ncbi:DUF6351 family protein [Steroidobacter flavus]|uniref:DUF6351 family protein n=1 Tax=Steroidobacter flavus TaxID=1842136 RepID=A0ABV8SWT6_9GAMM
MKMLTVLLGSILCLGLAAASAQEVTVLSSRPDTVSDGDALIAVALPVGEGRSDLKVSVGDTDVTSSFTLQGRSMIGLVKGLKPGKNKLTVTVRGRSSSVVLINHDRNGPIFSGPHQQPFMCETDRFKLPDGSTLGAPQDADCNAPTKVLFVYRSSSGGAFKPLPAGTTLPPDMGQTTTLNGRTVNYIVRVETGTINRSIYQMAMLFDPTQDEAPSPTSTYKGWNGRAVFSFGGGATAGYHQGAIAGDTLVHDMLSRGFAVMSSSLNVMAFVGSDVVSAETASMVKERFIETFGPPKYVMGWGGSGGSMQQHLIANNYPGILDGIVPGASFPDLYSLVPYTVDCALMAKAFDSGQQTWTDEQKRAAAGLNTWKTCAQWVLFFTPEWMWARQADPLIRAGDSNCHSVIPRELTYDRLRNPRGARCDIYAAGRNALGFDPKTGQTYRAYDNVGVQYGLKAYHAGAISAEQFVELNENVGGFDDDGDFQVARSVAHPLALRRMFEYGRINEAENLDDLPIIDLRGNPGRGPDVHDAVKSENTRARIVGANGGAAGHVMVRAEAPVATAPGSGAPSHHASMNVFALLKMDEWLNNIVSDTRHFPSKAAKVVANKPADLATDVCFMADDTRINEASSLGNSGSCGSKLPYFEDPRMTAGAPLTNDVLKCQLRPFRAVDYPNMAPALVARLQAVFSTGVCDYSKPSVGFRPLKGTWLSYPNPGVSVPMAPL